MTRRVRWTRLAEQDALDIYLYIARDNAEAAEKLLRRFDETLMNLLEHLGLGVRQPRYGDGVRSFLVSSYILFYREVKAGIELWRIIHGKRHIPSILTRYEG